MALRVIGAGVGRTGTHSLKISLEQLLDGKCHHMIEMFGNDRQIAGWMAAIDGETIDWSTLLGDYVAQVDWPGASFWPELSAANPDALVLLSVRDADDWYRSASNTIFTAMESSDEELGPWLASVRRMLGERFCADFADRDAMVAAYERHNAEVRASVPADRLLEWTATDGWEPICERLGLPVPAQPFPVTNTTEEFRAMMAGGGDESPGGG
ncbi:MAG TPA: sulfotransferase [Acidimicrobiales bacterium]|nr:sulfotransferase [Acidimicrobiales bacterium]